MRLHFFLWFYMLFLIFLFFYDLFNLMKEGILIIKKASSSRKEKMEKKLWIEIKSISMRIFLFFMDDLLINELWWFFMASNSENLFNDFPSVPNTIFILSFILVQWFFLTIFRCILLHGVEFMSISFAIGIMLLYWYFEEIINIYWI